MEERPTPPKLLAPTPAMNTERPFALPVLERLDPPRNEGPLDSWDGHARITGPCGDTMEFWLRIAKGRIVQANFTTTGCNSSRAAGSMATELAAGKTPDDAARLEQRDVLLALGGLHEESEHCALLAANTLKAAISNFAARRQSTSSADPPSETA